MTLVTGSSVARSQRPVKEPESLGWKTPLEGM